jgi:hypothetical protein
MAEQDIHLEDTTLSVWAERDRLHVALYLKSDKNLDDPLLSVWDESAQELFDDGFLSAGWLKDEDPKLKQSAFDYAKSIGRFDPANRVEPEPVPTGWVLVHDELGAFMSWLAGPVWIWSSDADQDRLQKGAYAFGSEDDAMEWFKSESDDEAELAENVEFMSHISAVEVVLDVTLEGHTRPRKVSIAELERNEIDLKMSAPALSI